jgi:hypothetical protein
VVSFFFIYWFISGGWVGLDWGMCMEHCHGACIYSMLQH